APCPHLLLRLFFFSSFGHHRDLHSFPTRRSSDLGFKYSSFASTCAPPRGLSLSSRTIGVAPTSSSTLGYCGDTIGKGMPHEHHRSEEHTSELQSRGHLVCRLLLEKKNKQKKHNKE